MARKAWAEITSLEHGHGGPGWELGSCLWSPGRSKDGGRRYGVMTLPEPGDAVVHLASGVEASRPRERYFYGTSTVATSAVELSTPPPKPGAWAGAATYYRIELETFRELPCRLPMEAIEEGIADVILTDLVRRPKYYPYARYRDGFRGAQGIYLTLLTPGLIAALREFAELGLSIGAADAEAIRWRGTEYAEGERLYREASYFRRNPALRAAAIDKHGTSCVACGFDFGATYGAAGAGYIEVHHLNPLSERLETSGGALATTGIDDVVPLCANCHRVAHRRRPALSLVELKAALAS
jgi:hypothetical protein